MKFPVLVRGGEGPRLEFVEEIPEDALLVGAFSAREGATWLPSPTLLLNANFADLSAEEIFKVALAERARFQENVWKSYVVEVRGPVAVISKRPEALKDFLETYGGLLELRPFSLKKDPSFPVIEDLSFQARRNSYLLSYLAWTPVEEERCLYCGLCGRACPKEALGPELTIDPERCDLCRECEKVCPEGALDLSRYERIEEEFPYLLFLEGPPSHLPRLPGRVFSAEEREDLFRQMGSYEVVEAVRHTPTRCQFIPRLGIGCELCQKGCPKEAVFKDEEGLSLDHLLCETCGLCVSLCPTGAMEEARFDDRSFWAYFKEIPLSGRTVIILSEETAQRFWWRQKEGLGAVFFLVHPNPRAVHLGQVLFLLARGAAQIVFPAGEAPRGLSFMAALTEGLLGRKAVIEEELKDLSPKTPGPHLQIETDFPFPGRRKALLALLSRLWEEAGRPALSLKAPGFGRPELDAQACTLCLACLNVCQTEALAADAENFALTLTPLLCVACGACAKVCPEGALSLTPGLTLSEEVFGRQVLVKDEPLRCARCGKVFGTKKSQERVSEKLKELGRFTEVLRIMDLCEDCRVLTLLMEEKPR